MWTNKYDPVMTCQPLGVPREGPPRRIYQTDKDITFIYFGGDAGGGYGEYRVIPTDGRPHSKASELDITYLGDTVGRWEGDTLVLDSVAFTDTTWLGRGGFFHSDQMHVVERFTRQGDVLLYDVTVEDPEVLVEPWVITDAHGPAATRIPTRALSASEATAKSTRQRTLRPRFATRPALIQHLGFPKHSRGQAERHYLIRSDHGHVLVSIAAFIRDRIRVHVAL